MCEVNLQKTQGCTLGWDWGSTAIRISLFVPEGDERGLHVVWNSGAIPGHDERYQKGAFNSTLYLDGKGKVYTGERADDDRIATPSKAFFVENPKTGNADIDNALQGKNSQYLWSLILKGKEKIARTVLKQVENYCSPGYPRDHALAGRTHGTTLHVEKVGLSYPAIWTSKELKLYEDLIERLIPEFPSLFRTKPAIVLHVESLACAHNLFWSQFHVEKLLGSSEKPTLVVFLDFGGHTMNGCMFSVTRRGRDISYFRVGEAFCASGGTQLWEQAFANAVAQSLESQESMKLLPRQRAKLLGDFHRQITNFRSDRIDGMSLHITDPSDSSKLRAVYLTSHKSHECFLEGLEGVLKLGCQKISAAAKMSDNVQVVLSGGSGKNSVVKACIGDACKKAGIADPYPFYELAGEKDSWNIARGAAIATANTLTGREFMEKGAAFGIQRGYLERPKKRHASDNNDAGNSMIVWDDKVKLALDSKSSKPVTILCSGDHRIRIICDPFLQSTGRRNNLAASMSYDIVELPQPKKGYWRFTLSTISNGDDITLSVRRDLLNSTRKQVRKSEAPLLLPLYFDSSSNCCLLQTEVDDKLRGLMVNENGDFVACPEESVRDQVRNLQNRIQDAHPRKWKRPVSPPATANKTIQIRNKLTGQGRPKRISRFSRFSRFSRSTTRDSENPLSKAAEEANTETMGNRNVAYATSRFSAINDRYSAAPFSATSGRKRRSLRDIPSSMHTHGLVSDNSESE